MAKIETWTVIDAVLAVDGPHALLYGPPGTGKSFAGQRSGDTSRGVYNVTITPDTPAAELRGHYVPRGGEFIWQDGPMIRAMREGSRLVLNEIDHAGGDVLSLSLACLDSRESCAVTLPTGETVRPAAGFRVVATMNGKPDDLLPALRDRFGVALEVDAPHPAAFDALPDDLQPAARGSTVAAGDDRVSLRSWLAFAELRRVLGPEVAAQSVFGASWRAVLDSLAVAAPAHAGRRSR